MKRAWKRLLCRIRGRHDWITAQCHWWDWGGSHLWTPLPPAEANGVGCQDCGRFEYVQTGAPAPADPEETR